jgi:hypothetical protein
MSNSLLLYLAGYSRSRLAKELLTGLHNQKARKEIGKSRKFFEDSLKTSSQLDEIRRSNINADVYRGLVLVCEMEADSKAVERYSRLWVNEHPDDLNAKSEWIRLAKKYQFTK